MSHIAAISSPRRSRAADQSDVCACSGDGLHRFVNDSPYDFACAIGALGRTRRCPPAAKLCRRPAHDDARMLCRARSPASCREPLPRRLSARSALGVVDATVAIVPSRELTRNPWRPRFQSSGLSPLDDLRFLAIPIGNPRMPVSSDRAACRLPRASPSRRHPTMRFISRQLTSIARSRCRRHDAVPFGMSQPFSHTSHQRLTFGSCGERFASSTRARAACRS